MANELRFCEGCRYYYMDWDKNRQYCSLWEKSIKGYVLSCSGYDGNNIDDQWLKHLENKAIQALYQDYNIITTSP